MLAIRMQRNGRTHYPTFRLVVQESQRHPLSGMVLNHLHVSPSSSKKKVSLFLHGTRKLIQRPGNQNTQISFVKINQKKKPKLQNKKKKIRCSKYLIFIYQTATIMI